MLIIDRVSHYFDQQCVLEDVSLECAGGNITCLIGPSGCGKTTLLRLIAGLLDLQRGEIRLDNHTLATGTSALAPEHRPVGMVFQEGALFPHMTVADNVAFGLRNNDKHQQAMQWLERVGLSDLANRYPDSLSGGQRQRVALARALAPAPRALLFDEPYANLDAQLRRRLREDARDMIRESGAIGLFVTHDPDEVMAMADHVAVLDQGHIVESGAPQTLYESPTSLFVAKLFGDAQVFAATVENEQVRTPFGVWARDCLVDPNLEDGAVQLVVHADQLTLEAVDSGLAIDDVRPLGGRDRIVVTDATSTQRLVIEHQRSPGQPVAVGSHARVVPRPGTVFASRET